MAVEPEYVGIEVEVDTLPDIEGEDDDEVDDEDEQYMLPPSLLEAAGIKTDEDWDALPTIDLSKYTSASKKK